LRFHEGAIERAPLQTAALGSVGVQDGSSPAVDDAGYDDDATYYYYRGKRSKTVQPPQTHVVLALAEPVEAAGLSA